MPNEDKQYKKQNALITAMSKMILELTNRNDELTNKIAQLIEYINILEYELEGVECV